MQGQGRLHAPHQGGHPHARLLRHRRRPPPHGGRRRLVGEAARHRRARGRLLRGRRHQHRRLPRGAEPGRRVEAARAVRLREQPVHGVHADRRRHGGAPAGRRPGARVRRPRRGRRRQRRRRRPGDGGAAGATGPGRRRARRAGGRDLPPLRAQQGRPGDLPPGRGGRTLAQARPVGHRTRAADRSRCARGHGHRGRRACPDGRTGGDRGGEERAAAGSARGVHRRMGGRGAAWRT